MCQLTLCGTCRAFSAKEATEARLPLEHLRKADREGYFYRIGDRRFEDGYLFKNYNVRNLSLEEGVPPLEELQRFNQVWPGEPCTPLSSAVCLAPLSDYDCAIGTAGGEDFAGLQFTGCCLHGAHRRRGRGAGIGPQGTVVVLSVTLDMRVWRMPAGGGGGSSCRHRQRRRGAGAADGGSG